MQTYVKKQGLAQEQTEEGETKVRGWEGQRDSCEYTIVFSIDRDLRFPLIVVDCDVSLFCLYIHIAIPLWFVTCDARCLCLPFVQFVIVDLLCFRNIVIDFLCFQSIAWVFLFFCLRFMFSYFLDVVLLFLYISRFWWLFSYFSCLGHCFLTFPVFALVFLLFRFLQLISYFSGFCNCFLTFPACDNCFSTCVIVEILVRKSGGPGSPRIRAQALPD